MGRQFVDLLRHADAAKMPNVDDLFRPLSAAGIEQTIVAQERYATDAARVSVAFHSPAPRAFLTQVYVLGTARPEIRVLASLWPDDDSPINQAFERYGYQIDAYLRDPEALQHLDAYAQVNGAVIWAALQQNQGNISVCGHAVLQNAIAFELAKLGGSEIDGVYGHKMAPCSMLRLGFDDRRYIGYWYHDIVG